MYKSSLGKRSFDFTKTIVRTKRYVHRHSFGAIHYLTALFLCLSQCVDIVCIDCCLYFMDDARRYMNFHSWSTATPPIQTITVATEMCTSARTMYTTACNENKNFNIHFRYIREICYSITLFICSTNFVHSISSYRRDVCKWLWANNGIHTKNVYGIHTKNSSKRWREKCKKGICIHNSIKHGEWPSFQTCTVHIRLLFYNSKTEWKFLKFYVFYDFT